MTARDIVMSAAGNAGDGKTYIEDVFSTYLYTGNGSTQTITNGIDLAGKGGMVWTKVRDTSDSHSIFDTARGTQQVLQANTSNQSQNQGNSLTSFNSNGFDLGSFIVGNWSNHTYASWTFRKAPKFFDVVTYTGNGVAGRTISHSLGQAPGMIIVKCTSSSSYEWGVYHRSTGATKYLYLNYSISASTWVGMWNNTEPSATEFTIGNDATVNSNGQTYVAYLFAHDTTTDGLIQCGSFTGTAPVNLGWEPQWVLIKRTDSVNDWFITDSMRGLGATGSKTAYLNPNTSGAETSYTDDTDITATGFVPTGWTGQTCIYMAIRRGPMKTPTLGTTVFKPALHTGNDTGSYSAINNVSVGFDGDMAILAPRNQSGQASFVMDKLRGKTQALYTQKTNSEENITGYGANQYIGFDNTNLLIRGLGAGQGNYNYSPYTNADWVFKRAPGFFDMVCYTGTGSARTVNHNLGVAPELMIVKNRTTGGYNWNVYAQPLGNTGLLLLDSNAAADTANSRWNSTAPSTTAFSVNGSASVNGSGDSYVAYLFASCPGVSKVGSYTGNGSSQNINCGFTNGARFVLIKRTDGVGNWIVFDTARGITSGNDPALYLNSTASEVTYLNYVAPYSAGFALDNSQADINESGASYIYLAIA